MVCGYYAYIVKNNLNCSNERLGGEKTIYHDPTMTHREASIRMACFARDGLGFTESFVKAFLKEFDNIVTLYENQPTYSITSHFSEMGVDGNPFNWTKEDVVKTWGVCKDNSIYTKHKPRKIEMKRIK